jgi:hypothetical protein
MSEFVVMAKLEKLEKKLDQIVDHLNRIDRRLDEIQAK